MLRSDASSIASVRWIDGDERPPLDHVRLKWVMFESRFPGGRSREVGGGGFLCFPSGAGRARRRRLITKVPPSATSPVS